MAEKDARTKLLAERDALVIAKRFIDCLHTDIFPEMGDLHLFGVGCEYAQRATEVLAVWQGSLKHGNLEAEVLAQALMTDNVRAMFEDLAYKLANSRTPNSSSRTGLDILDSIRGLYIKMTSSIWRAKHGLNSHTGLDMLATIRGLLRVLCAYLTGCVERML